jgi:hypothetical protein
MLLHVGILKMLPRLAYVAPMNRLYEMDKYSSHTWDPFPEKDSCRLIKVQGIWCELGELRLFDKYLKCDRCMGFEKNTRRAFVVYPCGLVHCRRCFLNTFKKRCTWCQLYHESFEYCTGELFPIIQDFTVSMFNPEMAVNSKNFEVTEYRVILFKNYSKLD